MVITRGATLKAGMTERRNDGMAESRNGGKLPQILKDGIAESRNGGKYPQILKDGMTENHPKSQKTESRKIKRNPRRRNRGKSTEILKDGFVVLTYTASTAQAYTTSTARDICTLAVLCSVFVLWSAFRPFSSLHSQASQAQNTLCMPQLVYIENCLGKSPIVKKTCVNNYLI